MIEKYSLYDGEVLLEFDTARHLYSVDGRTAYGVTNIVGVIGKPQLMYWAVNQACDNLKSNIPVGLPLDEVQISQLLEAAKRAHLQTKDKAADIGTMIHDWCEKWVKASIFGGVPPALPINREMRNAVRGFLSWLREHDVRFTESERKVYSRDYHYAGTLDAEAYVDGQLAIIDFKTSSAIYPEYFLQTSAYTKAREEETHRAYGKSYVVRLSKKAGVNPFEVASSDQCERHFSTFISCLQIYEWQMRNKKAELLARAA